jgi:hypothetical protein
MLISLVGYESLKVPVSAAVMKKEFVLKQSVKNLEPVMVFKKQEVLGSTSESIGYYRSWSTENTGGEIGRFFYLPHKKYKIDKVRFKVANLCDTCLIRVHIRAVKDGKPDEEILKDSITLSINKLSLDDKVPEFDLTGYDYTYSQDELFISLEVLNCANPKKGFCSFSFAGTDKGAYLYKSKGVNDWQQPFDDYTIYLKVFLRY